MKDAYLDYGCSSIDENNVAPPSIFYLQHLYNLKLEILQKNRQKEYPESGMIYAYDPALVATLTSEYNPVTMPEIILPSYSNYFVADGLYREYNPLPQISYPVQDFQCYPERITRNSCTF